jgi:hypothetical protein
MPEARPATKSQLGAAMMDRAQQQRKQTQAGAMS